ncbi:hypothetical protein [Asticcacaulis benevestitus]|uniref:Uncharacterized protein n=1 Tax=Asticcacaulis benevestitus DSM 16100 = ATCC BAA-896 TaxID=1121022 RepID=V4PTD4_9CAUL|nr:hypothetical protein [Asticcacaulis benevestitus]ESQ88815.1 hypothetical protein ABENE_15005 [Asticcacaulis benevestitus DSM 16100 = ATCC BAA-896]
MRKFIIASAAVTLLIAPAAQAQDPNICPVLRTVLDASVTHFKSIKGKKIESDTWKVTSNLPYADNCQIDNVLAPEIRYKCFFSSSDRSATPSTLKAMGDVYANNIGACRNEFTRATNEFSANSTDFSDASGVRVDVTVYSDFFTVGVYEPQS